MPALLLPPDVTSVLKRFYTCEFTTVNSKQQPLTWPTEPFYHEPEGEIIVTSSIAFPIKAYNARRNPHVALLYSDSTGSGLEDPPAVLVQGTATSVEELTSDPDWSYEMFKESMERQPAYRKFVANSFARSMFTFQFQRLAIFVHPQRILAWPHNDFTQAPVEIEVAYVE
ncbi:MAG TPA: pyridoxamine 5'-phosphate oxidase family protein [Chloroflexia bacterium]|nr:pyridoxamine 5'-phosphate oxidase family protein [Chloroflexia bacterium]